MMFNRDRVAIPCDALTRGQRGGIANALHSWFPRGQWLCGDLLAINQGFISVALAGLLLLRPLAQALTSSVDTVNCVEPQLPVAFF